MNSRMEILKTFKNYYISMGIVCLSVLFLNVYAGLIVILASIYIIYKMVVAVEKRERELDEYIEKLSDNFDSAAKHAVFNMPFPLVLTDIKGKINWCNSAFLKWMKVEHPVGRSLEDLIPQLNCNEIAMAKSEQENLLMGDKHYIVFTNVIDVKGNNNDEDDIMMFYFVENSDYYNLLGEYNDERIMFGHLYVDNYNEARTSTDDINRPQFLAEVDKLIINYFTEYGAVIRKYENDKYIVILNKKTFEELKEDNFSILDKIKELYMGNSVPATISMGISNYDSSMEVGYNESRASVDIALARGGDQIVVRAGDGHIYFGGRSKAQEKSNRVRARVIGLAVKQLIDQADRVFIMGHRNPDMDSIGAGIGILRAVKNRDKDGYIILNKANPSIDNLLERMKVDQPSMVDELITTEKAKDMIDSEGSLLILVDNHKPSFTEAPELIDKFNNIVVIDHHRRGTEFIDNPVLTYIEPYASSTCELVTEMLSYMSEDSNLTNFEAEALMAGIMVDTKGFSFQTGVRTFEAASNLKRIGVDMTRVKQLFKDDFSMIKTKASVIEGSEIRFDNIAIGAFGGDDDSGLLVAAQAADELLEIEGIVASFVLYDNGEYVNISGRSLGDISVQLILESIGGGGHQVSAGAQLKEVSLQEAINVLEDAIENYLKENGK